MIALGLARLMRSASIGIFSSSSGGLGGAKF